MVLQSPRDGVGGVVGSGGQRFSYVANDSDGPLSSFSPNGAGWPDWMLRQLQTTESDAFRQGLTTGI